MTFDSTSEHLKIYCVLRSLSLCSRRADRHQAHGVHSAYHKELAVQARHSSHHRASLNLPTTPKSLQELGNVGSRTLAKQHNLRHAGTNASSACSGKGTHRVYRAGALQLFVPAELRLVLNTKSRVVMRVITPIGTTEAAEALACCLHSTPPGPPDGGLGPVTPRLPAPGPGPAVGCMHKHADAVNLACMKCCAACLQGSLLQACNTSQVHLHSAAPRAWGGGGTSRMLSE
jgi:hypothetical protein